MLLVRLPNQSEIIQDPLQGRPSASDLVLGWVIELAIGGVLLGVYKSLLVARKWRIDPQNSVTEIGADIRKLPHGRTSPRIGMKGELLHRLTGNLYL